MPVNRMRAIIAFSCWCGLVILCAIAPELSRGEVQDESRASVDIDRSMMDQQPPCFELIGFTAVYNPVTQMFDIQFQLKNLTPDVVEHMFVFPDQPPLCNQTMSPDYIDLPTLPPNATTGVIHLT